MPAGNSVSQCILLLKAGEAEAAQQLWSRYARRLVDLARAQMRSAPAAGADEEDIAQSVFTSVCRGAAAGRLESVVNRDDLWWLLLAVTKQKVVDHIRRETAAKRGNGRVRRESDLMTDAHGKSMPSLDELVSSEPTAEFLAVMQEQQQRLLALLRDQKLQEIAVARIEGYAPPEIAEQVQISQRSVERKLQLIRSLWAKDLLGE